MILPEESLSDWWIIWRPFKSPGSAWQSLRLVQTTAGVSRLELNDCAYPPARSHANQSICDVFQGALSDHLSPRLELTALSLPHRANHAFPAASETAAVSR